MLGDAFVQIEHGVLANVDAVSILHPARPGGGCLVGVLVNGRPDALVLVEDLVASRKGRQELLRRLSSR
jgi:hypothetical protein